MKKKLLSLMMLGTLAACGGGGGGSPATSGPAHEEASQSNSAVSPDTAGNDQAAAGQRAAIISRFDSCPVTTSYNASGSAGCLAGTYTGIDVFTATSCTVRIEANGATRATRGNLSIEMGEPNIGPIYAKNSYLPIASTSPLGYTLNWVAGKTEADYSDKRVTLIFNEKFDERLTIEVSHNRGSELPSHAINCGIQF